MSNQWLDNLMGRKTKADPGPAVLQTNLVLPVTQVVHQDGTGGAAELTITGAYLRGILARKATARTLGNEDVYVLTVYPAQGDHGDGTTLLDVLKALGKESDAAAR